MTKRVPWRRWSAVATLAALACTPPVGARAQDAPAILKKMYAAYAALNTYTQKTSITLINKAGPSTRTGGGTAELRFQRPNRLYIAVHSPTGSMTTATDGREQISYNGAVNQFMKRPAPPTPAEFVKNLRSSGIDVKHVEPIFFLVGNKMPPQVVGITAKGTANVNGAPCYVVEGKISMNASLPGGSGSVTFWIDSGSYLLRKVLLVTTVQGVVPVRTLKNGKTIVARQPVALNARLTELVQELQINPPLNGSAFVVAIPKGAIERNIGKYLKK